MTNKHCSEFNAMSVMVIETVVKMFRKFKD